MDDLHYKVIFQGDVLPGKETSEVQGELAKLFGVETDKAARLFTGKERKLKSNITLDQAKKYVRALAKLGALAFIVPQDDEEEAEAPQETPNAEMQAQFTRTGSFDVSAFRAYFEKMEAEKNEPEADHEILSLDNVGLTKESLFNTQENELDTQTVESGSTEPNTEEDKPVTKEMAPKEDDEEIDERSGVQNVISSEVLKKLIQEQKKK